MQSYKVFENMLVTNLGHLTSGFVGEIFPEPYNAMVIIT